MTEEDWDPRPYIEAVRWQFARTMPQWPHWYTIREWAPEREAEFERFVRLIRAEGIVKPWPRDAKRPRYRHAYLIVDGWEYWTMGWPVEETTVINRARLEDQDREHRVPSRWCPECGNLVNLRRDGSFIRHYRYLSRNVRERCPGSGTRPPEAEEVLCLTDC